MHFQQAKNHLIAIFDTNHFSQLVQHRQLHACQVVAETCSNGTPIVISFPGYKAAITAGRVIYDYRVDVWRPGLKTSLSHANIVTDIFHKIVHGGMCADAMRTALVDLAQEGTVDIQALVHRLPYVSSTPPVELRRRVALAHAGKPYNAMGNAIDWTLEELFLSMKWIVLQEDMNYPISLGYEGRKMPFARYLETIFITRHTTHTLEDVIARTLMHSRPPGWADVDYSCLSMLQ